MDLIFQFPLEATCMLLIMSCEDKFVSKAMKINRIVLIGCFMEISICFTGNFFPVHSFIVNLFHFIFTVNPVFFFREKKIKRKCSFRNNNHLLGLGTDLIFSDSLIRNLN